MVDEHGSPRYPGRGDAALNEHAVVVEELHPVVVRDAHLGGFLVVEPDRIAAAGQGLHPDVLRVGGVDAPLAVRGDVVEQPPLCLVAADLGLGEHRVIGARLVRGQVLTPLEVVGVVQVEVLPARQGPPGNQLLDVEGERAVGAAVVDLGTPGWSRQDSSRL